MKNKKIFLLLLLACLVHGRVFGYSLYFFNSTTNIDWGFANLPVGVTVLPMTDDAMYNDTMLYYFVQNYGIDDKSDWVYYPSQHLACRYYPESPTSDPGIQTAFNDGLLLAAVIVAGCIGFTFIRSLTGGNHEDL